ncbi:unnamed protein product [Vicia faba]|uniref:C2H2-type domain-containing protein n=1 Tax=Vicia faba TaxID=3906 RepID=A0AAV0ZDU2_VICFA|nr:unnamed protein product [Vicia faba]
MAFKTNQDENEEKTPYTVEQQEQDDDDDDEEEVEEQVWDDWEGDDGDSDSDFICLFCDSNFDSCSSLFQHCTSVHHFDFHAVTNSLNLDFYASFKLINYIRSKVSENSCWSCGLAFQSKHDLQNHLHDVIDFNAIKPLWHDDRYLKPFMQDDSLLYNFGEFEEGEDEQTSIMDEDLVSELKYALETNSVDQDAFSDEHSNLPSSSAKELVNGKDSRVCMSLSSIDKDREEGSLMDNPHNHIATHIKKVNESYFGSYSSFGIHREMLSDKARMDAYGQAISKNPSLLNGAVVMDVGCGTGILSLFAAQAGASRVIAVEASAKMAAVASRVAKDNNLLSSKNETRVNGNQKGVVEVVHGMVEEIDKIVELQPHSVDVLLSEWMGYCLLYESMLGSVLYARDRYLKPGGAILPDTATIFVAGFGKGGTSLPFWENVCDFDMSSIGEELVTDAARYPIVDVIDHQDLVTSSTILQTFDLATMKPDEVDFTATASLEPKSSTSCCWCYGVVLWFDTGFTTRFCKETPAVLSTSPYTPKTHWSQTILTFREPIAIGTGEDNARKPETIGTEVYPAAKIDLRVSIVRSTEHRSIDISMEAAGVSSDGRRHSWPVQLISLQ